MAVNFQSCLVDAQKFCSVGGLWTYDLSISKILADSWMDQRSGPDAFD